MIRIERMSHISTPLSLNAIAMYCLVKTQKTKIWNATKLNIRTFAFKLELPMKKVSCTFLTKLFSQQLFNSFRSLDVVKFQTDFSN